MTALIAIRNTFAETSSTSNQFAFKTVKYKP